MIFKELKSGYPIYLLERSTMRYEQGKVMNVGTPHPDVSQVASTLPMGGYGKLLVDVCVQTTDGKQNTYSFADTEQTAYAGSLLLATSKDGVISEVTALKSQAEAALSKVDEQRDMVTKCEALLRELDTAYKERQATEARFEKLEGNMGDVKDTLKLILSKLNGKS